jgi:hypothetical protein
MGSQPFDPSSDSLQVFASETPIAPAQDSEPFLLGSATLGDAAHSIFALDHQEPQRSRVWPVATISVMVGFLAGFVAGYGFAHRAIVPAGASARTARPASPGTSHTPRAERAPEPARGPDIAAPTPAPALPSDARAFSVPSAPSSTTRPSTTEHRGQATVPATVPTTGHAGAIEVLSHPQGAQVFLDGSVVGRAPLSLPDVPEGTHDVRLELPGFNPWVASVRVTGGSRTRVGASLEQ